MERNNKTKFAAFFSLLVISILCFAFFAAPVSAADGEGSLEQKGKQIKLMQLKGAEHKAGKSETVVPVYNDGKWNRVHSDQRVFNRNFQLSPEQKEYTITECEKVASEIRNSSKSDLEKYYKLAIWLNKYVNYDWDLWNGGYDLAYYSHQWDSYGVFKEQKSICAGIAITYATLCHAADLPCKFIRVNPKDLDHTINYIPDINGHAYYIDVTENMMFMSNKANCWSPMDIKFSRISSKKIPDDGSFEYYENKSETPSTIKDYYDTPFADWFKEYALHKNTKKVFKTKYVEKGSGNGEFHASYKDYPKQYSYTEKPEIWFLEDFYQDPKIIKNIILNKELDEQVLNISGIKGSYDCDTAEELAAAVAGDMLIKYFPSSENGEVVAKAASLTNDTDYTVACDTFDTSTGEAKLIIRGAGEYSGEHQISVRIHSAAVTKLPVNNMDFVYTGKSQPLVEPGNAENGTILYAAVQKDESKAYPDVFDDNAAVDPERAPDPTLFSEEIPTATYPGKFEVWFKIKGDENHFDVPPQRLERTAIIAPVKSKILVEDVIVKEGEEFRMTPVLDSGMEAMYNFTCYDDNKATVSEDGVVKGVAVGNTTIYIDGKLKHPDPNHADSTDCEVAVTVTENPYYIEHAKVDLSQAKFTYNANVQKPSIEMIKGQKLEEGTDYTATWSNASSKNVGKYTVTIEGKGKYTGTTKAKYKIIRAANPMTLKGRTAKVKYGKIKNKATTIKRAKVIALNKAKGKQKYKLVTAKKGKKNFRKYFSINAKNGNVTVKKGLKKGRYTVKARVRAAGNTNYKPSAWKTVTFKVQVK